MSTGSLSVFLPYIVDDLSTVCRWMSIFCRHESILSAFDNVDIMSTIAPKLIIPATEHFTGRVTYRGTGVFAKIKARFEEFNLNNTVKESHFGNFWNVVPLTFSSNLVDDVVDDTEAEAGRGSEPQPSAPSSSGVRGAEYTDLVARLDRIEADTQGLYAAHVELKKAYETSHVELKGGQNVIMEQLRHILAMLNRPPTTASAPEAPADPSTPPPAASPPVEEDEVFPDDYDPYEGAPATPIEAQPLIHVHDTESQGEILSIEAQPAVVKSRKRKRKPPVWFGDYTEMKRRHRPSSTFDPLEPPDEKLLTTFRKWCVGLIPNHRLRDLRSGDYGPGFFWIMLTPKEWLTDDHIDAAMHLLRRRRTDYPLTFPQKGIILSTFVTAMISSAWTSHKGPRKNFKWEDYILDYCTGAHKSQVFERWRGNEFIYFVLNLPTARHWVTVEVDIELWKINVYDCDSSVCHWTALEPILKVWAELLPSLILATG
ncbi:uncharacterized protein LOC133039602 [Cannabis sativa]|uniref:uncharacterized protein LOC133039602 n=1 Tax=Cannabis sativa TaxID=3483 RepID=UPI0029CA490A|nr:uncharacterized protein LOC133039602 [Cannabis sativa]